MSLLSEIKIVVTDCLWRRAYSRTSRRMNMWW